MSPNSLSGPDPEPTEVTLYLTKREANSLNSFLRAVGAFDVEKIDPTANAVDIVGIRSALCTAGLKIDPKSKPVAEALDHRDRRPKGTVKYGTRKISAGEPS